MRLILLFLLLCSLASCHYERKCGAYVDKWREGKTNQQGVVAINCNGTTYNGNVDDATYANAKEGDEICVEVLMY